MTVVRSFYLYYFHLMEIFPMLDFPDAFTSAIRHGVVLERYGGRGRGPIWRFMCDLKRGTWSDLGVRGSGTWFGTLDLWIGGYCRIHQKV